MTKEQLFLRDYNRLFSDDERKTHSLDDIRKLIKTWLTKHQSEV